MIMIKKLDRMENKNYYILYKYDGEGGVNCSYTKYESIEHALMELSIYYIPFKDFIYIDVDKEGDMYYIYVYMQNEVVEYSLILAKDEDLFINQGGL